MSLIQNSARQFNNNGSIILCVMSTSSKGIESYGKCLYLFYNWREPQIVSEALTQIRYDNLGAVIGTESSTLVTFFSLYSHPCLWHWLQMIYTLSIHPLCMTHFFEMKRVCLKPNPAFMPECFPAFTHPYNSLDIWATFITLPGGNHSTGISYYSHSPGVNLHSSLKSQTSDPLQGSCMDIFIGVRFHLSNDGFTERKTYYFLL